MSFFSFIDHLRQFSSGLYNNSNNHNIPLRASFEDNPDNPVPERKTVLDFAAARDDEDTGGDNRKYANIVSVKIINISILTVSFYRPDVLPVAQPTLSKH